MKAKVKTGFPGRPDGEMKTREILPDEEITGDLARVAVQQGWATPLDAEAKEHLPKKTRGK